MSEDLARGLDFLHKSGIAHLDIKPHNMVYDQGFNLYLIDFDAAERVEGVDSTINQVRGTEPWMAPEVIMGPYSPILADRFSCGRVFGLINRYLGNKQLAEFSEQLKRECPRERPPVEDWLHRRFTSGRPLVQGKLLLSADLC
ncbi:kinase-like domain-containing protein [Rhodocollybia butyracea]|uniref:Kinase-like domain-containing protein n=1 Tax=Rhodocollybia butyracea TaxID=206335 RepID=A0A9P5UA03_9AGAR|nr:kinase-like domain-containing protein [Rhodocollybia butyracea]